MTRTGAVALTGYSGFVGGAVGRALAAQGLRVHAWLRPGSRFDGPVAAGVQLHRVPAEPAPLAAWLRDAQVDAVVHVAAHFVADHGLHDVLALVDANLRLPAALYEAMRAAEVGRIVCTGTSWQHAGDGPPDGRDAYLPANLYAATKQAGEDLLAHYVRAEGFRAITLKLLDTYGPGDRRPKLFNALRTAAAEGRRLMMSGGAQEIDPVHVDDVVEAYRLALARLDTLAPGTHESYKVDGGAPRPLREVVEDYLALLGRPGLVDWGARPYRRCEVMQVWRGGRRLPGWSPRIGMPEGLRTIVAGA